MLALLRACTHSTCSVPVRGSCPALVLDRASASRLLFCCFREAVGAFESISS